MKSLPLTPFRPFDWRCLPPCPKGIVLPEVSHSEFIRFLRGDFNGFKLTFKISSTFTATTTRTRAEVGPDGQPRTRTTTTQEDITGDSEMTYTVTRIGKKKCGQRNCQKARELDFDSENLLTYGTQANVSIGNFSSAYDEVSHSTHTTVITDSIDGTTPINEERQYIAGAPLFAFTFLRSSDNSRRVRLFAIGIADGGDPFDDALYIYAPVSGNITDFHQAYGIPEMPESGSGGRDDPTYSEVTGTLEFLGVTLNVWGWKSSTEFDTTSDDDPDDTSTDAGNSDSDPTFTLEEL